jgi:hypothetical protein
MIKNDPVNNFQSEEGTHESMNNLDQQSASNKNPIMKNGKEFKLPEGSERKEGTHEAKAGFPRFPAFWSENPNILFDQKYILEFFPVEGMTYNQKLNSITRVVILLTIIGFTITRSMRLLLISLLTISAIYFMHYYHNQEKEKKKDRKVRFEEGFEGPAKAYYTDNNLQIPDNVFATPDDENPFSNVLVTDYDYNPNKKPAPPAFNSSVNDNILKQAKQLVMNANPDQPDIADKLFKDLGEQYVFEQSLRPFHSNPSTTIPNDQGAFAEFCYGGMVSCKEGNKFACARNLSRHTL